MIYRTLLWHRLKKLGFLKVLLENISMSAVTRITTLKAKHTGLSMSRKQSSIHISVFDNLWHLLTGLNCPTNPFNDICWSQTPSRSFLVEKVGMVPIQCGCENVLKYFYATAAGKCLLNVLALCRVNLQHAARRTAWKTPAESEWIQSVSVLFKCC